MSDMDLKPIHPILLQVGAAVQDSQRLEFSLSYIMTLLSERSGGLFSGDEFEQSMESFGRRTLGRLIATIREFTDLDSQAEAALREGLEARNFIIHHFFVDRTELFFTIEGRRQALIEVRRKRESMIRAFELLDPLAQALMRARGFDPQARETLIKDLYKEGIDPRLFMQGMWDITKRLLEEDMTDGSSEP